VPCQECGVEHAADSLELNDEDPYNDAYALRGAAEVFFDAGHKLG
jgi:hypothetical protein